MSYPLKIKNLRKCLSLWREARLLRKKCEEKKTIEDLVGEVSAVPTFSPIQKKIEIIQLLKMLKQIQPRYLCEIGGKRGGTLSLFCQIAAEDARILSIDTQYTWMQRFGFSSFAKRHQKVACLAADSHSPETRNKVLRWLKGHKMDFLFIDGDHSFSGVSTDYQMYAPLVRPGGIIAFHDIVPDFKTRYGIKTNSDVGEVPKFWAQIKDGAASREFIEDVNQDGYGIGVLQC